MHNIKLQNVIPAIFSHHREDLDSDVWKQNVIFERGMTYLIEADSGKGKSTFCSYMMGYRDDYDGCITFDDTDIRRLNILDWVRIRREHISLLFQELRLFPELTAYENVDIKNSLTKFKTPEEIKCWFDMLGIADKLETKTGRMAFGQQQRVAMIRALVQPFDFIIVDEPTSHLDDTNSQIMGRIMTDEAKRQGAGIIVTSIGKHIDLNYDKVLRL